jgi:hypothetical protein
MKRVFAVVLGLLASVNIGCSAYEAIHFVGAISNEATVRCKIAKIVDRRQAIFCCELELSK